MAILTQPIKKGKYWTNIISEDTGESINFEEVTTWYDGTPMDDSKADGEVYRKLPASVGGGYVRRVYDNFGQLFLEKNTVAEMRALSSTEILLIQIGRYKGVKLNGYYEKGDTPAPIEYYLSDTAEVDDGGSVIEVGGIKLEHDFNEVLNILYFGAIADNFGGNYTDNQDIFNRIISYLNLSNRRLKLFFPPGYFYTTQPLDIRYNIDIDMLGVLVSDSPTHALKVGTVTNSNKAKLRLDVIAGEPSDWEDINRIGIILLNTEMTTATEILRVQRFTIGVQIESDGRGSCYNKFFLGDIVDNKIGLKLTQRNNGWVNENLFFGGRFRRFTSTNNNKSCYGIVLSTEDGTYTNTNNNNFYEPSIELRAETFTDTTKETLPILIEHGQFNAFYNIRDEGNRVPGGSSYVIRTENESQRNYLQVGYGGFLSQPSRAANDVGSIPSTTVDYRSNEVLEPRKQVCLYESGALRFKTLATGSSNLRVISPELYFLSSAGGNISRSTANISKIDDYLWIPSSRGIVVKLDTSRIKSFVVIPNVAEGAGRVNFRCFDSSGVQLTNADASVRGISNYVLVWSASNFGGCWRTGSDRGTVGIYAAVSDNVSSVEIIISGGSTNVGLRGLSVFSTEGVAQLIHEHIGFISPEIPTDSSFSNGTFISDSSGTLLGWKMVGGSWTAIPLPS